MPFRILPEEPVDSAVRRIAREQVDRAISEAGEADRGEGSAIHRVRKRCKKIRGLLRLVRPQLGEVYGVENTWYRDSARSLSGIRDAQTVVESFESLMGNLEQPFERKAFAGVRLQLVRRRERIAEEKFNPHEQLREFRDRMREGRKRIESWHLEDSGFDALAKGLGKTYSRGCKAMARGRRVPDSQSIHEWRKHVKDHWYHMRLLRFVWDDAMKARRDDADALSDCLGAYRDLSILREVLSASPEEPASSETLQALFDRIENRQIVLKDEADALGIRLFAEARRAFVERIEGYWNAWQGDAVARASRSVR